jgi:hypothetical protein
MKLNNDKVEEALMNPYYIKERNYLINLLRNMNSKLKFRSQTFFLAIYYMDLIFNDRIKNLKYGGLEIYAVASLLIAAKFDENDPNIPDLYKFQEVAHAGTSGGKFRFYFKIEEIKKAEVLCIKALAYKLNYYSFYHFLVFFFAHGIVFEEDLEINEAPNFQSNHSYENKLKITEKVYSFARELLDIIIEKGGEIIYHLNLHIACAVVIFSKEYVLNFNSQNGNEISSNLFRNVYGIELFEYEETYNLVKLIFEEYKKIKDRKINSVRERDSNYIAPIDKKNEILENKNHFQPLSNVNKAPLPLTQSIPQSNKNQNSGNANLHFMKEEKFIFASKHHSTEELLSRLKTSNEKLKKMNSVLDNNLKPRAVSSQKEIRGVEKEKQGGLKKPNNHVRQFSNSNNSRNLAVSEKQVQTIELDSFRRSLFKNEVNNNLKTVNLQIDEADEHSFDGEVKNYLNLKSDTIKNKMKITYKSQKKENFLTRDVEVEGVITPMNISELQGNILKSDSKKIIKIQKELSKDLSKDVNLANSHSNYHVHSNSQTQNFIKEKEDLVSKTRKIFGEKISNSQPISQNPSEKINLTNYAKDLANFASLASHKLELEKISNEKTPSTIIINNNININAYINKDYLQNYNKLTESQNTLNHKYSNALELNYDKYFYGKDRIEQGVSNMDFEKNFEKKLNYKDYYEKLDVRNKYDNELRLRHHNNNIKHETHAQAYKEKYYDNFYKEAQVKGAINERFLREKKSQGNKKELKLDTDSLNAFKKELNFDYFNKDKGIDFS